MSSPANMIDETGNRYGRLTVLARGGRSPALKAKWLCECLCGRRVEINGCKLRKGLANSCGCARSTPIPDPQRDEKNLPGERWATVEEFPNYEISTLGRLRRLDGHFAPTYLHRGYPHRGFWGNGKSRSRAIHALVARAFLGPRPDGFEVAHLDGDPGNPRLDNLAYTTPKENNAMKVAHGTYIFGEDAVCAKLTAEIVREARRLWMDGHSFGELARRYGVSQGAMSRACRGINWRQVPMDNTSPSPPSP